MSSLLRRLVSQHSAEEYQAVDRKLSQSHLARGKEKLFDAKVSENRAMESSDENLEVELREQTFMKKDEKLERVTEWIDSSLASNILS